MELRLSCTNPSHQSDDLHMQYTGHNWQGYKLSKKLDVFYLSMWSWTHWPLTDVAEILKYNFPHIYAELIVAWVLPVKLLTGENHSTSHNEKSTLVQVTCWCRQATSHHHLSQCWPSSKSPNGISGLQWVDKSWMANLGWGAVSDLSLISDLSQKFKHDLWSQHLILSQKQHLTPGGHASKYDRVPI